MERLCSVDFNNLYVLFTKYYLNDGINAGSLSRMDKARNPQFCRKSLRKWQLWKTNRSWEDNIDTFRREGGLKFVNCSF
jgi:hypothetical protein